MKIQNIFTKALSLVALAGGLALIISMWQTRQVRAIQDSEDFPSDFGFIELAAGQTARLNVVGIHQPPPERDTPGDQRARRAVLAFDVYIQDEENSPNCGGIVPLPTCLTRYRFLRRESREVQLMPGQAASFDFVASAVQRSTPQYISSAGRTHSREPGAHQSHTWLRRLKCVRVHAPSLLFQL